MRRLRGNRELPGQKEGRTMKAAFLLALLLITTASAIQLDETTSVIGCGQGESCWMQMGDLIVIRSNGSMNLSQNVSLCLTEEVI
jgi:hypothetical protein